MKIFKHLLQVYKFYPPLKSLRCKLSWQNETFFLNMVHLCINLLSTRRPNMNVIISIRTITHNGNQVRYVYIRGCVRLTKFLGLTKSSLGWQMIHFIERLGTSYMVILTEFQNIMMLWFYTSFLMNFSIIDDHNPLVTATSDI